jgi:hypothetical protein
VSASPLLPPWYARRQAEHGAGVRIGSAGNHLAGRFGLLDQRLLTGNTLGAARSASLSICSLINRFAPAAGIGSPLVLSRVHWVRPEMVVEVSYVEWTPDGLLRHVVYLGEREDTLAIDARRDPPHAR